MTRQYRQYRDSENPNADASAYELQQTLNKAPNENKW